MSREQLREQRSDTAISSESNKSIRAYERMKAYSQTERERAVIKGIEIMRDVFRDTGIRDHYAVFASTAIYLQGRMRGFEKKNDSEYRIFHGLPSDFDAVVSSESNLIRIRAILEHLPGHVFEHNGQFRVFRSTGTKLFAGYLEIEILSDQKELIHVPYPFEIFIDTDIVNQETLGRDTEFISDFHILSLEALKKQYEVIHQFDMRVEREAGRVIDFLSDGHVRNVLTEYIALHPSGGMVHEEDLNEMRDILQWLELTPDELHHFYEIKEKFDISSDAEEKHRLKQNMIHIVSGFSVKTAQREEKIASLHLILSGKPNNHIRER